MPALAIVIPTNRPIFLRAALDSLAAQTDRRFRVYVGDDAGPPEIREICVALEAEGLDLVYERFEQNLGGKSLAAHWNRCVRLTSEPWVWLFADDDVMEPGCVAAFHAALENGPEAEVLRFDTTVIGARGQVLSENPRHPRFETGTDFIYARLMGRRNSYVVEYVFQRETFDRVGGFPESPDPAAWCTDDTAWYLFSQRGGIQTLAGPKIRWRASGLNITDAKHKHQREKLEAGVRFLRFIEEEIQPKDASRSAAEWRDAAERWYAGQVRYLMPLPPRLWGDVLEGSRGIWRRSTLGKLATLAFGSARASIRMLRTALVRRLRASA